MPLLYHWRGENYREDVSEGQEGTELTLEQNNSLLAEMAPGDRLWAFTRREDGRYVLAASFRAADKSPPSTLGYGAFSVSAEPGTTVMYDVSRGQDVEPLLRSLAIPINATVLGHSFQGLAAVRTLSDADSLKLSTFADRQPLWYSTGNTRTSELTLWDDYTREAVHRLFSPRTRFTSQTGTWGLQGILPVPGRQGDFVFFVTLGKQQGEHAFDESISRDGVLTWQSQPAQTLDHATIRQLIQHDDLRNNIYLFFRTRRDLAYTYLGRLSYVTHDRERERPVHFRWQLMDWPMPTDQMLRIGLTLVDVPPPSHGPILPDHRGIFEETPPPARMSRIGTTTRTFRTYKGTNHRAEKHGRDGEELVVAYEKARLDSAGRPDLASLVKHVAADLGDGAGYDVLSYNVDGSEAFIEVKTTTGGRDCMFFLTSNELAFSEAHPSQFVIYRVFDYDPIRRAARLFKLSGNPRDHVELTPTQYRATWTN